MEKMEESAGAGAGDDEGSKEIQQVEGAEDQEMEDPERGRPSTPKWWRPPVPPETYKWEEMRRQRQKGGYPWTHLDKEEELDFDDYLDDNLYEPVNPPPLYGNESYLSKDLQQVPQFDEPMIDIPPELDIISSEGLDGLDKPDPHDRGFDGDREWQNDPEEPHGHHSKSALAREPRAKSKESRPTTPKSVGFNPETLTHEISVDLDDQEVPEQGEEELPDDADRPASRASSGHSTHSGGHGKRQTAFDILKAKATVCADHVKQRIRLAIPVRPKLNQWQGVRKSRRKKKVKHGQEEEAEPEGAEEGEKMEEGESPEQGEQPGPSETIVEPEPVAEEMDEETKAAKLQEEEELKRKKEEEKLQQQKEKEELEAKKAEEKLAKQKAAEEAKKAKEEEKARIAEEKRKAKEDEDKRKQAEKEEAARIAAEKKKEAEAKKAAEKAKKEEEARKAAELKKEEDARKAAEKAVKEEEARKAAEAKKAELEAKKAAEKAKKEEDARIAAEKKAEEAARKAEEKLQREEDAKAGESEQVEEKVEEIAEMAAEGVEADGEAANEEVQEVEEMDVAPPQTPSGTTKRKYIMHRRQLPEIPNPITALRNRVEDFKNKLKRSRTPPRRQVQRKHKRSRSGDASKSPPRDIEDEPEAEEEGVGESKEQEVKEEPTATSESKSAVEVKAAVATATPEIVAESVQTSSAPGAEADPCGCGVDDPVEPAEAASTGTRGRIKKKQPAAEKLDKIGQKLKGFGAASIGIASQATKVVGQNMKVVGKDLQKLGSKAMGEIKAKQEAAKNRKASQGAVEMGDDEASVSLHEAEVEIEPPKRSFRLRRRNESQEQADEEEMERDNQGHFYENAAAQGQAHENRLLGSGTKDWESPHERAHSVSEDVSEEPYSGDASARDSPRESSLASSTFAQVRRTGVLEEIDSDEFFLRERGISEGEDAEEVNRFLVEELRQAFRPTMASNALSGFDMEPVVPPPRPERTPRKPPRKEKEEPAPPVYQNQTFPPERPKRKGPQGYVSKFMKDNEEEYDDMDSNEEVRGSSDEMRESESVEGEEEAVKVVRSKLSKIESEEEETQIEVATTELPQQLEPLEEYEDDGRYEPISEGPVKPSRTKRSKPKRPPTPPSFHYNTIAANEWLRGLESTEDQSEPAPPMRKRRGSGKSSTASHSEEGVVVISATLQQLGEQIRATPTVLEPPSTPQTERTESDLGAASDVGVDDYIDEAGYAIVQKDREVPTTIPRKKKKRAKAMQAEAMDPTRQFLSMPRGSPRTIHIVPPSRPNRTYSTLKPRRPPRSKSNSRSPSSLRRDDGGGESPRPSNLINLMQGRPLPPPPRPTRSPALLDRFIDLDQSSIEQSVGLRHYANFDDIEPHTLEEVFPPRVFEVDMACQTDPVPEDEFIVGSLSLTAESLQEDGSRIITASSRLGRSDGRSPTPTTAGDVSSSFKTPRSPHPQTHSSQTQPDTDTFPSNPSPTFMFPSRLHLHELEVDFIKVNELCAQTIRVENLQASQVEINSMNTTGTVCAPHIRTQSLRADEVNCNKLSSDIVDTPSNPPLPFYQLSSPDQHKLGSEQELCLKTEEKGETENESACPLEIHDLIQSNVDSTNLIKSSHVAEKLLDKQLNVAQSSPASQQPKTRKDASVGTLSALPRNVPAQMNNLNQEASSITQSVTSEQVQHDQSIVENRAQPPRSNIETEESSVELPEEEGVVRGSYSLPYSYMSSQPATATPAPITRERSSLKRNQRSTRSKSPTAGPPREESRVAFGHTSVAEGEVLSVKLSIPVDKAALAQSASGATPPTTPQHPKPPRLHRTISPPTEAPSGSLVSTAESPKKNVQKPPSTPPPVRRASSGTSQQLPSPPPVRPPPPSSQMQADDGAGEGLIGTSIRLGRAVLRFTMRSLQAMAEYIDTATNEDPGKAEQQRANMQVLLCLLLVLVVGLILATTRSGPYITPRWEFLMPPPDL